MDDGRDAIGEIAERLKTDLNLMAALLDDEAAGADNESIRNGQGEDLNPSTDGRLRVRLRAVVMSLEAVFIDPSLGRVDLSRHLKAVAAMAGGCAGRLPLWADPACRLWAPARQASYAGLALADLVYSCRPIRVRLSAVADAVEIHCALGQDERLAKGDFSKHIITAALGGRCASEADEIVLIFPILL